MKNYYEILGVKSSCDFIDVINAYNKSIKYFNEKKELDKTDKEILKEIKESYFILGNYHNRRKYDNNLEGYKKVNENYSDRIFYRPNLEYNHTIDLKLKNTKSDILNNKKNRLEKKKYNNWEL